MFLYYRFRLKLNSILLAFKLFIKGFIQHPISSTEFKIANHAFNRQLWNYSNPSHSPEYHWHFCTWLKHTIFCWNRSKVFCAIHSCSVVNGKFMSGSPLNNSVCIFSVHMFRAERINYTQSHMNWFLICRLLVKPLEYLQLGCFDGKFSCSGCTCMKA